MNTNQKGLKKSLLNCNVSQVLESRPFFTWKEKSLYSCWLNHSFPQEHLRTLQGNKISILSSGKRNELEGPDFSDALILIDDQFFRGNVEIHLESKNWYIHKHHEDPVYNSTILHVVVRGDPNLEITTQDGKSVPTLVLLTCKELDENESFRCEEWKGVKWIGLCEVLMNYSQIRFQRKCLTIQSDLMQIDPEQYFYKGLSEVLGYSRNREAFKALADKLPISMVYDILSNNDSEKLIILESLYFGTAGFLNSNYQRFVSDSKYLDGLKEKWCSLSREFDVEIDKSFRWHFAGSRPVNHPTYRIAALVQIIYKMFPDFPGQLWINQMGSERSLDEVIQWTRSYFQQPCGMWKNHPLFAFHPARLLIGNARLMDICTNLLFPFSWAIGSIKKKEEIMTRSTEFAKKIGKGEIPSSVQKMLSRLSIPSSKLSTNCLIQGAIEFLRRFCDLKLCKLCPLEQHVYK